MTPLNAPVTPTANTAEPLGSAATWKFWTPLSGFCRFTQSGAGPGAWCGAVPANAAAVPVRVRASPVIATMASLGSRVEGRMESSLRHCVDCWSTPHPQLRPRGGVVSRSGMTVRYARIVPTMVGIGVRTKDARLGRLVDTAAHYPAAMVVLNTG
jgi:hypothetical protein